MVVQETVRTVPLTGVILCGEWRKHCPRLCPFHIHALTVYIQSGQGHVIRRGIANTQSMFRIAESQLLAASLAGIDSPEGR